MSKLLRKEYLTDEIIESLPKKKNTSKKDNNTHRNKKKTLNTSNFVSSIFFYRRKPSLLFFSAPMKMLKTRVFFETMQSHWGFISSRRLFPTFGNLTVIKYKNLCESK